ncbi:MAG: PQQ-binding-like beta-propeller repeat protein [Kiritimatiellaceae bacterium]|nr:PQQ-binding-like beta-propeller repeat protein [Kiritimatiellaceae bacterium]
MSANKKNPETDRKDAKAQRFCGLRVLASLRSSIVVVLLACSATPVFAEWGTYHGGADLRGVSEAALPETPQRLWRYNAGGAVNNTPVSDGERIFFTAKKGLVTAIDLKGSEVWKKNFTRTNETGATMPVRFDAPLICAEGTVLAGTASGMLIALDVKTGVEKWRYDTGGVIVGSPNWINTNQVVVIDQSAGVLHGLDLASGKLLWKTDGMERSDGSPGVGSGRIVFGSCMSALHVYSAADGSHLRDIEVGDDSQVAGGAAVDGNLIFAGTRDGSLICADMETGKIIWSSAESKEQTFSTPAVTGDKVIYSSDNGFVYAVTRADGRLLWSFNASGLPTSPVVAKDKVAVSSDGVLYLLNLADGRKLWSQEVSDGISSPALIGGLLVVGADDGTVGAYGEINNAEP